MRRWVVVLAALLCASCASETKVQPLVERVRATPEATGNASVSVATAAPTTAAPVRVVAAPAPTVRVTPKPVPVRTTADLSSFRRLGSWIDIFDYSDDPASIRPLVTQMANLGTKTLYLETARSTSPKDISYPQGLGIALDEAKARGMRVIAWYPPAFDDMNRDIRRTIAAANFRSAKGNRFDGFGADIEYTNGVPDHAERSRRAVDYSKIIRARLGKTYALAAIVIPPTSLEINKKRWPAFPWAALAPLYDVFMPMNYWTAHGKDAKTADDLTRRNVQMTQKATGRPVHIIGGLGEDADVPQVRAYVDAARAAGSLGGGLYDFTTTKSNVWGELRRFG
jgi:uncharacterized lipoprotein YddW (UPF0748 family)